MVVARSLNRVAHNVSGVCDGGGVLALNFIRRTELSLTTNVSAKHGTPAIAKPLVIGCFTLRPKSCRIKFYGHLFSKGLLNSGFEINELSESVSKNATIFFLSSADSFTPPW